MRLIIKRPCDGFTYHDYETHEYKTGFCHESRDHFQVVTFESLEIEVRLCACAWNDKWGRRETIHEFVCEHYAPLVLSNKDHRRFKDSSTAYRTGSGGQHCHSWDLCGNPACGYASAWPHEWTLNPTDEFRGSFYKDDRHQSCDFYRDCVYCSFECFALARNLKRCVSCNSYTTREFNGRWATASFSILFNAACNMGMSKEQAIVQMCFQPVCSSLCASRHIEKIKETSRQLHLHDKETECLHEVKALVRKAKKALKSNDHGALSSLRREFEQVGTSQE